MNKLTLYVFAFFSLMSCGNDIEGEDEPEITPVYQLTDIQYSLEEGDGETEEWVQWPDFSYVNQTSLPQTVTIPIMGEVNERSYFSSDDKNAFPLAKTDSTRVLVPTIISDNEIHKMRTFLYTDEETTQLSPFSEKTTTEVPPNKILIARQKIRYRILRVTYTATFEDRITGQQYKVKGKWNGSSDAGSSSEFSHSEIKQ